MHYDLFITGYVVNVPKFAKIKSIHSKKNFLNPNSILNNIFVHIDLFHCFKYKLYKSHKNEISIWKEFF